MRKSKVSKRLIAVLVSLCLIFSSVIPATILSVGAVDGDYIGSASWEVPEEAVKPGDTFEAFVFLNTDTEIGGIQFDAYYDPDVLTVTNLRYVTPSKVIEGEYGPEIITIGSSSSIDNSLPSNSGTFRVVGFNANANNVDPLNNFRYLIVTFQVAEDCTATETEISLVDVLLGSYDNVNGTIVGNTQHEGPVATINIAQPEPTVPTGSLALQVDKTEASMGDEVTISVLGTSNVPVAGVQYEFSYDTSKLKFVGSATGEGFSSTQANVDEENGVVRNMLVGVKDTPELTESNLNNTLLTTYTFEVISMDGGTSAFNFDTAETKMGWYNDETGIEEYVTLSATDGTSLNINDSNVDVTGIALSEDVLDFSMDQADNQTATLVVTETPEDNTQELTYTWTSEDDGVATVVDGVVTAVGPGTTTITVEASNGMSDTATVYVSDLSFDDSDGSYTGVAGQTVTLAAPTEAGATSAPLTYTWSTSNPDVATVDNGVVTFVGSGNVSITVTASNGVSFTKDYTVSIEVPMTGVLLNAEQVQLSMNDAEKQSFDLDATYRPDGTTDTVDSVTWESSNTAAATVDDNGVVTAVDGGRTTITVTVTTTGGNKFTDSAEIYVSDLSFDLDGQTIQAEGEVGDVLATLNVDNTGADITPVTYTYTSSNPSAAAVDDNGVVTFVGDGTTTITIEASNGITFTVTYEVRIHVEPAGSVVLSVSPANATIDDEITVTVYGTSNVDVNSLQYEFSYDPSKLDYVSTTPGEGFSSTTPNVDEETGTIRNMLVGINNNPDLVNGILDNDVLATYTFKVITLEESTTNFTWNQGETKMGRYDGDGEAYVPLSYTDGSLSIVDSTVPMTGVLLNAEQVQLSMNDADNQIFDLDATYRPEGTTDTVTSVVWESSNPAAATVDNNGVVTAVDGGRTTITVTVTTADGKEFTDSAEIYVSDLSFDLNGQTLDVEGTAGTTLGALAVTNTGADITPVTYTYTSSNPDVMSVNANGEITLVGNGSATITIAASNGVTFTVTYNVSIVVPATGIQVSVDNTELTLNPAGNNEATITVTPVPGNTTDKLTYTYTSSDQDVVTVDENGAVTVVGNGTATVTVTAENEAGDVYTEEIVFNVGDVNADTTDLDLNYTGEDNTVDMNDYFVINGVISNVDWSSDNEAVATVDENGVVTFVSDGSVTITGTYSNGLSYSKTFNVTHDCSGYLVHVDRVEPTTETEGNIEYWYCSFCGKYYADAEGTQEISAEDTILAKLPGEETPSTPGGSTSTPGDTTSGGDSTSTPQTNDSSNLMLWSSLAVLALLGLGTGVVVLKKKSRSK